MLAGEGRGARFRLPASGTRGDYTRVVLRPSLGGPAAAGDDAARMGTLGIPVACTATWFQPGKMTRWCRFWCHFVSGPGEPGLASISCRIVYVAGAHAGCECRRLPAPAPGSRGISRSQGGGSSSLPVPTLTWPSFSGGANPQALTVTS